MAAQICAVDSGLFHLFGNLLLAGDNQFTILDGLLDRIEAVGFQVFEGLDLIQQFLVCVVAAEIAPGDLLPQQLVLSRALVFVALDDPAHPFSSKFVGIVFALDQDETAVAAVFGVLSEDGVC